MKATSKYLDSIIKKIPKEKIPMEDIKFDFKQPINNLTLNLEPKVIEKIKAMQGFYKKLEHHNLIPKTYESIDLDMIISDYGDSALVRNIPSKLSSFEILISYNLLKIDEFTNKHLIAILAHELGHIYSGLYAKYNIDLRNILLEVEWLIIPVLVNNYISKQWEHEADKFSIQLNQGRCNDLIDALDMLLWREDPMLSSIIYKIWYFLNLQDTHPSNQERQSYLEKNGCVFFQKVDRTQYCENLEDKVYSYYHPH